MIRIACRVTTLRGSGSRSLCVGTGMSSAGRARRTTTGTRARGMGATERASRGSLPRGI